MPRTSVAQSADGPPAGDRTLIVSFLVGCVLLSLTSVFTRESKEEKTFRAMREIRELARAVEAYSIDHDRYPGSGDGHLARIRHLIQPTYLDAPRSSDPWGHAYQYEVEDPPHEYWISSRGADGAWDPNSTGNPHGGDDLVFRSGGWVSVPAYVPTAD